jgi:hypothetical protein
MASGFFVLVGFGPAFLLELLAKIDPHGSDGYAGMVIVWYFPFIASMFAGAVLLLIGIVLEIARPFEKSH